MQDIQLSEDYPSKIARQLINGEVDLALVPVAIIPQLKEYYIVGDCCIGAEGPVASVALFSDSPLSGISRIFLDYQSKSSVALLKILLTRFWKIKPKLLDTTQEFSERIKGPDAGLLIGDRALAQLSRSRYIYDLAEAWIHFTGLPFVFAAWISNKKLPADFILAFNAANHEGLDHISAVVRENSSSWINLQEYYTNHISYLLTSEKRKGLEQFLELLSQMPHRSLK